MSAALLILPNFVLIMIGLALARRFDYGRDFWQGLEKLVYYVLFPALLFRSLATAKLELAQAGWLVACACAFTIVGFVLSLAAKPLFGLDRHVHATGSQCGYRFNTYVGLAIAGSLFGTPGVALAALLLGVMIPLANLGAVGVLAAHSQRGFFGELVRHPLVVSSVAGFAWNLGGLTLPGFADQTLALLGQSALPAGLLCIGAAMRIDTAEAVKRRRHPGAPLGAHAWWLAVKMGVLPAIAWMLAHTFAFGALESRILLLCAALPTAPNAYILAVRMTGDGQVVATQITIGTVLAMLTLPLWMSVAL